MMRFSRLLSGLVVAASFVPLTLQAQAPAPAPSASAPAKADLAKGQTIAGNVCVACHAFDGSRGSPANPIIQGQHPDYLVKQLREYKSRKREHPIMTGIASTLSDDDMKNVAAFYASKLARPGFATNKELALVGARTYRGGVAERSVPSCAGCHGPAGAGIPAQYPLLAGQHADYTAAQLVAFRGDARKNNAVMSSVAARLSDRDIRALADFLAGLR